MGSRAKAKGSLMPRGLKEAQEMMIFALDHSHNKHKGHIKDCQLGNPYKELCTAFEKLTKDKFQMSFMGELTFFLGFQYNRRKDGIFISQDKYVAEILKKFNYTNVKSASTLVDLEKPLVKDGDADDVDVHLYRSMIGPGVSYSIIEHDFLFCSMGLCLIPCYSMDILSLSLYAGAYRERKLLWWLSFWEIDLLTKGFDAGRHVKRGRDTKIPQSSGPPVKVSDEVVHKELGDSMERDATTSLEAEFETTCKKSNDLPLSRGYTLRSGEDSMKLLELMENCTKLCELASIRRHLKLEDFEGLKTLPTTEIFEQLALMSPKKTAWEQFSSNIATAIICLTTYRTFNFSNLIFEAMVKNIDSRRRREVSTGSGGVSTASRLVSTADISTASELDSTASVKAKDKGKELAKKVFEEEQASFNSEQEARFKAGQEQERIDIETALELQKQLDEREEVATKVDEAHDID
ncbi:putative ribonuclease H-like domain-containing protein [Tanacetum coccineum]